MDGATGPSSNPTLLPSATGPTGPVYIATIDQLITSQTLAVQQETADRTSLLPLLSPESFNFTQSLQQWANAGFPALYTLTTITLSQPSPCSDGTTRTPYDYVCYLLGTDLGTSTSSLNSKFLGITVSYVLAGSTLQLCATKE